MSTTDEYEYDEQEPEEESSVIRKLRQENKRLAGEAETFKTQAERTAELERENAFFKAKLPDDLGDAHRKAIQAIATEATPEGFRKAAEELGFIQPPAPTVSADELAAQERVANLAAGGNTSVDITNYEAEIAQARNADELFAVKAKYNMGGRAVRE